jgi:hypothetical protein
VELEIPGFETPGFEIPVFEISGFEISGIAASVFWPIYVRVKESRCANVVPMGDSNRVCIMSTRYVTDYANSTT